METIVDQERVEHAYSDLEKLRRLAWSLPLQETAALSERVRVELMIDKKLHGPVKRFYRAYSDYLDDVVEERSERENHPREAFHNYVVEYIRGVLGPDND